MKVTKYLHSCLLVEDQNTTILLDPGNYTYQEKVFPYNQIAKIDYIAITHEHRDHMDIEFLKELLTHYPHAQIIGNESINTTLIKENMLVQTVGNNFINLIPLHHEKVLNFPLPINCGITLFNELLHPGDSLQFLRSPRVLALPIVAPWGSLVKAAEQALLVEPKVVIPIHDWHLKDEARHAFYQWLVTYFMQHNITFLQPETGQTFEV
ncbi:MAG TPA: MBL fold metallo-hydrolase [Patescibacteria group bacterium]|nr:MBL fold metallo-hydrolase [Patescibacteria group bacterium]